MTLPARLGVLLLAAGFLILGWQAPAAAHAGGLVASDARSRVVAVTPPVAGLVVTAIEDGAKLRLVNGSGVPVTVPGGGGPATPAVVAPGKSLTWADTRSTPVGRRVAAGSSVAWSFAVDAGGRPVTVTGVLVGSSPPFPVPWWALTVALAVAIPLLSRRSRRGDLVLAGVGLVALLASLAHIVWSSLAVTSAPLLGTFLNASGINLLAWPLIIGGAVAVLRGKAAGVLAICAGAALTAVFVLPDVTSFHRAVLPFAGPAAAERVLVALALGCGAGVAVGGAAVLRTLAGKRA